jgi:adenylate cyclase
MFRFQYKLTVLIVCIILSLLVGTFYILQGQIENNAIETIKDNLKDTQLLIARLMKDRRQRLWEIATGIAGSELVRVILTDPNLDRLTRNDIVETEILSDYPHLNFLAITDAESNLLAINAEGQEIGPLVLGRDFYSSGLDGIPDGGFLIHKGWAFQILALPVTIGFEDEEEILGVLLLGVRWTAEDLQHIKTLSKADVAFFYDQQIFLSTTITLLNETRLPNDILQGYAADSSAANVVEPIIIVLEGERFLYVVASDSKAAWPPYIIAKSLDRQLIFVKEIQHNMIQFGVWGIFLGSVVSLFFALGISRPIKQLQTTTREVAGGNLKYRVDIRSRDEFSQLGKSFNRMIEGLYEKERMRGIMDKVVSKEIADEILHKDFNWEGEERIATVLFSDIRDFTTFSETLDPKELLMVLNTLFTKISACIEDNHGNINTFLGDAVMALFGVPKPSEQSEKEAILAALDMIDALNQLNQQLTSDIGRKYRIGIGINTGRMVAGGVGSIGGRMDYAVIGDEVNLASRLEGLTKQYGAQIIVSESTYRAFQDSISAEEAPIKSRELDIVRVKGKATGVKVYQIFGRLEYLEEFDDYLERFQEARQLLNAQQLKQSLEAFTSLKNDWQADKTTAVFYNRVRAYANNPERFDQEYRNGVYISPEK